MASDRLSAISSPIAYLGKRHQETALRKFVITILFCTVSVGFAYMGDLSEAPAACSYAASSLPFYRLYVVGLFLLFTTINIALYRSAPLHGDKIAFWAFKWGGAYPSSASYLHLDLVYFSRILFVLRRRNVIRGASTTTSALAVHLNLQAKVTKVVSYILGVYVVLWVVPSTIYNVAALARAPATVIGTLAPWVAVGSVISAASNVFIYSARLPDFKSYVYR